MNLQRGQVLGLMIAGLIVWLVASALFGETGLMSWVHRRHERERVGVETMRLARETHTLEGAIARLAEGDGLEVMARQQLGLVRPNEVVYRFRRPPPAPAP